MFKDSHKPAVFITGANRGLGLEITKQLLEMNWNVVATARDLPALTAVFADKNAENLILLKLDVTSNDDLQQVVAFLKEHDLKLNVLINNAGIGTGETSVTQPDMREIREIFDVNLFGGWAVTGALLPFFKAEGERCVINVSSQMGAIDELKADHAAYRLSKASLNALSLSMGQGLKHSGIKVHAVCPGWIKTDMGGANAPGSLEAGASNVIYLAETPGLPGGRFWRNRKPISW
jgi:NAD(P)-dependent dehydrogenase (short-subunit alcohol dehydrogenase family)